MILLPPLLAVGHCTGHVVSVLRCGGGDDVWVDRPAAELPPPAVEEVVGGEMKSTAGETENDAVKARKVRMSWEASVTVDAYRNEARSANMSVTPGCSITSALHTAAAGAAGE